MSFAGKVAIVTGGSSGIGEVCAMTLAALGAQVVLAARTEAQLERVTKAIDAAGGQAAYLRTDVTSAGDVEALVAFAVSTFGGLHVAVNNAGITHANDALHDIDVEVFDEVIATNLRGTFLSMRAELAHMVEHGGGSIVNMASGAGLKGAISKAAYSASKHGIVGLTRTSALDYATRGVRINAVAPGSVLTPIMSRFSEETLARYAILSPMERWGTPQEIADAVAFLASDKATFVTGTVLEADGGFLQGSRA